MPCDRASSSSACAGGLETGIPGERSELGFEGDCAVLRCPVPLVVTSGSAMGSDWPGRGSNKASGFSIITGDPTGTDFAAGGDLGGSVSVPGTVTAKPEGAGPVSSSVTDVFSTDMLSGCAGEVLFGAFLFTGGVAFLALMFLALTFWALPGEDVLSRPASSPKGRNA